MGLYLGIDAGTTKVAAVVVDATTGRAVALESAPEPGPLQAPAGRSEWDAEALVDRAFRTARAALATSGRAHEVAAIGVTGQQHGMVLVSAGSGSAGRPLTPLIGWQDRRCDEPAGEFPSTIAWMRHRLRGVATARTGCPLASGFLGATLFWLAHQGRLPDGPALATFLPDFVVARLCEQPPVTDPTNAGSSGVFDAVARGWHTEMLGALDLPVALLPPVRPTGAVAGRLAATAAAALSLPLGTPVFNALGDNQASFFGSVGGSTDDLLVNVGTGGQVSAIVERFVRGDLLETRPYLGETYLLVGAGVVGGRSYALLRDFIRQVGRECFGVEVADDLYPALNALAAAIPPGSEGLRCDPRFGGNRFNPDQRGSVTGIDGRNFTPGHLARAALEGLAATFHTLYGNMLTAGLTPRRRLVGSGNGLRRNPLLVELLSSAFAMPLVNPRQVEEAAHGAAILAAVGTGELSLEAATVRLG